MSVGRFFLAALAGALLCYWVIFVWVAYLGTGTILWDGQGHSGFSPSYFASLYGPPIVAALFSYFALRARRPDGVSE